MTDKQALKKIMNLLKTLKNDICLIFTLAIFSSIINVFIPYANSNIVDEGLLKNNINEVVKYTVFSLILYLEDNFLTILKEKRRIKALSKLKFNLEKEAFEHLLKIKMKYLEETNSIEIWNNLSLDINNIVSIMESNFMLVISQIFSFIGGIIGLFILNYKLILLVFGFIPIKCIVTYFLTRKRKEKINEYIEASQRYSNWYGDTIGGIREIKLYGIQENKKKQFIKEKSFVIEKEIKMTMVNQWNNIADSVLMQVLLAFIYIWGAKLVFISQLSVGSVFAFVTYCVYIITPVSTLLNIGYCMGGILPSVKRYSSFIGIEEENYNYNIRINDIHDKISFKNIYFTYKQEQQLLKNINFIIKKNEKIAIIGLNGSGKTTLVDLLLRILEPQKGTILLDDIDINKLSLLDYRKLFSVVSQNIYLFNDTIANNIMLGDGHEDTIMEACRKSGLENLVKEVSLEYNVGVGGNRLSCGQKQKIAMARALAQNRPIIIFDEVTSSMDALSVQQVCELIKTELKNKTVILITHKNDIIKQVDKIIEINSGTLIER